MDRRHVSTGETGTVDSAEVRVASETVAVTPPLSCCCPKSKP